MKEILRSAARELNDPKSVTHGLLANFAPAFLTLIDPSSLRGGRRVAYRLAIGTFAGWSTWVALRDDNSLSNEQASGIAVGTAGVTIGLAEPLERMDARIHDGLVRRGVKRPRLALAVTSALFGAASMLVDLVWRNRADAAETNTDFAEELSVESTVMTEEVRHLVSLLLSGTDDFGAAALRTQLATARLEGYVGEDENAFYPGIGFVVDDALPRAVPGDANFPVIGRYHPLDGHSFDVYLSIQDGKLASLSIGEGDDWSAEALEDWESSGRSVQEIQGWPTPGELALLIETPQGYQQLTGNSAVNPAAES